MTQPCVSGRNFKTRLFFPVARHALPSSGQHIRSPVTSLVRPDYSSHTDSCHNSSTKPYATLCEVVFVTAIRRVPSANPPTHFHFICSGSGVRKRAGIAQSVKRLATGWTVRSSNPGGGDISRTRPDRSWGPPRLLYNG